MKLQKENVNMDLENDMNALVAEAEIISVKEEKNMEFC